jgi:hypothetical protein
MIPIILIGSLVAPALLLLLLRTNTAVVFFSLCAGSVLVNYGGDTVITFADSFFVHGSAVVDSYLQIGLLFVPALLSTILLRKSFKKSKLIIFALPAFAVSLTGLLLVVPLLPGGVQHNVMATDIWKQVDSYRDFIILVSFVASLVVLWISKPSHKEKGKKH